MTIVPCTNDSNPKQTSPKIKIEKKLKITVVVIIYQLDKCNELP